MQTTADFLDSLKSRLICRSDAELGERMKWKAAQVSRYRTLRSTFSDDTALKVAELCQLRPEYVFACMKVQQAQRADAREAWQRIADALGKAAALAVIAATPFLVAPEARAGQFNNSQIAERSVIHIAHLRRRRRVRRWCQF
jgi:hypothetical protein